MQDKPHAGLPWLAIAILHRICDRIIMDPCRAGQPEPLNFEWYIIYLSLCIKLCLVSGLILIVEIDVHEFEGFNFCSTA